jgi:hypothetical protein
MLTYADDLQPPCWCDECEAKELALIASVYTRGRSQDPPYGDQWFRAVPVGIEPIDPHTAPLTPAKQYEPIYSSNHLLEQTDLSTHDIGANRKGRRL